MENRGILRGADTKPTPTPTPRRRVSVGVGKSGFLLSADTASPTRRSSNIGAKPAHMPTEMAETSRDRKNEASTETSRSCAAPLQCGCAARLQKIWDLDASCNPDVYGRSCLISERSWLANAPCRPRYVALIPAVVWSSPRKLAASAARVLAGRTPVAGKSTLWLTALDRGALCAAETTAHGAAAVPHTRTRTARERDHCVK